MISADGPTARADLLIWWNRQHTTKKIGALVRESSFFWISFLGKPDGADGTIEEIGALARESSFLRKAIMAMYIDLK